MVGNTHTRVRSAGTTHTTRVRYGPAGTVASGLSSGPCLRPVAGVGPPVMGGALAFWRDQGSPGPRPGSGPLTPALPPQVVHAHRPHFLALHCQEFGGKNYEASMSHVDKFVK